MTAADLQDTVARVRRPAYATSREAGEHLLLLLLDMTARHVPLAEQQAFEREFRRQTAAPPQQQAA